MQMKQLTGLAKLAIAMTVLGAMAKSAEAITIDFGTSWPAFVDVGTGNYASAPYDRVIGVVGGDLFGPEAQIAALINGFASTSYVAGDVQKTDKSAFAEQAAPDGYFTVPAAAYLVVQYDGPQGGSVVINLGGNDAKVPYDSSIIWGTGDQYGVSHFAIVGGTPTPDGGATAVLLGGALVGLGLMRRRQNA
jgi:hypothetical protein